MHASQPELDRIPAGKPLRHSAVIGTGMMMTTIRILTIRVILAARLAVAGLPVVEVAAPRNPAVLSHRVGPPALARILRRQYHRLHRRERRRHRRSSPRSQRSSSISLAIGYGMINSVKGLFLRARWSRIPK